MPKASTGFSKEMFTHSSGFLREFETTAQQYPDKIAVVSGNSSITFAALNAKGNQLSRFLRRKRISTEKIVIVYLERSIELTIAFLGILKAGGIYLPLDPHFTPQFRLSFIVDNAQADLVLTQACFQSHFLNPPSSVVLWEDVCTKVNQEQKGNFSQTANTGNLAYIMFTSGSTGNPKGVMVSHGNLSHCARAMQNPMAITPTDVYIHTASFAFSSSIRQLTVPLSCGATVVIASTTQLRDPHELFLLLQKQTVTIMDILPSFWRNCLETLSSLDPTVRSFLLRNNLRLILSASEALPYVIPYRWNREGTHGVALINMYGQTETTGIVLTYPLNQIPQQEKGDLVPLGNPIANTRVSILTQQYDPISDNRIGEIHIVGEGLARGYLHHPGLTAEKFVPNPCGENTGSRMYRTGDSGRYNSDGNIQFQGRRDTQMKIRGHRVELGEVEVALCGHPSVAQGLIVKKKVGLEENSLIAYVIPRSGGLITKMDILEHLRVLLPFYMIPDYILFIDQLPLTITGKIDRQALSGLEAVQPSSLKTHPAPETIWERRIADIWKEVLGLEKLEVHENFFNLGGQSLKAIQIINRIRKSYHISLPIQSIFDCPTIAGLAQTVEEISKSKGERLSSHS
jgi:amino acid adenylation domain-containing protein